MAAAPASSMRRILPSSSESGEAETTSGFFRVMPRYFVVRSIIYFVSFAAPFIGMAAMFW